MLRRLINFILSSIPQRVPIGMTEFNQWADAIIAVSGLPNNESTRKAAAGLIFQIPPKVTWISIRSLSNRLVKNAALQVAASVIKGQEDAPKA